MKINCIDCGCLVINKLASFADRKKSYGYCLIRDFYVWQPERSCTAFNETVNKDAYVSIEAAYRHHLKHGDMDGRTCLLSACALHYPKVRGSASTARNNDV